MHDFVVSGIPSLCAIIGNNVCVSSVVFVIGSQRTGFVRQQRLSSTPSIKMATTRQQSAAEWRASSRNVREFPGLCTERDAPLTLNNRRHLEAADALLLRAAADGDVDEVARLLKYDGASVDAHDVNGTTAAHAAAKNGNLRLLDLLSDFEANLDKKELHGLGGATVGSSMRMPLNVLDCCKEFSFTSVLCICSPLF